MSTEKRAADEMGENIDAGVGVSIRESSCGVSLSPPRSTPFLFRFRRAGMEHVHREESG